MKDRIRRIRRVVCMLAPIVSTLMFAVPVLFGIFGGGRSGGG